MNVVSLNNVSLDGNVIRKGGSSGGGSSSGSEWVYIRLADIESDFTKETLMVFNSLARVYAANNLSVIPGAYAVMAAPNNIISVALDKNLIIMPNNAGGVTATLNEMLLSQSINLDELPQITKEEFYSTDV